MSAMRLLNSPYKFFWAGLICVFLGFALPFLTVLKYIEPSFFILFMAYIFQLIGMILGIIAAAGIAIRMRTKDKKKKQEEKQEKDEQESTTGWME